MMRSATIAIIAAQATALAPGDGAFRQRCGCGLWGSTCCTRGPEPLMVATLPSAILGGTAAGGLHAVTGPDHLAALMPLCMGRRWWSAATTGAFWGLGHGVGAALVGAVGYLLRGMLNMDVVSSYMEVAVGASIIVIGATGLRDAQDWARSAEECSLESDAHDAGSQCSSGDVRDVRGGGIAMREEDACGAPAPQGVARTLLNGVFNGVSGTGHMLGVLPALAMPNWAAASVYLSCFGLGTIVAMTLFTGLVGEITSRLGTTLDAPTAPANMAGAASLCALLLGSVWTGRALGALGLPQAVATRLVACMR